MNIEKVYLIRKLATMPAVVLKETEKRVYLAVAVNGLTEPLGLTYYWVTRTPECIAPRDSRMLVDDLVEKLKEGQGEQHAETDNHSLHE